MKPRIAIWDYGMGNLRSAKRGLEHSGAEAIITDAEKDLERCDALVLPGVGAFCDAMVNLRKAEKAIGDAVEEKPVLGICLGLQLLFSESEEGGLYKGLDLVKGRVVKLPDSVKAPQMGWNSIKVTKDSDLLAGIEDGDHFYFVHSYYAKPQEEVTTASTSYGVEFPAVIEKGNLFATQFHPEKSGKKGLRLLENFVGIVSDF